MILCACEAGAFLEGFSVYSLLYWVSNNYKYVFRRDGWNKLKEEI